MARMAIKLRPVEITWYGDNGHQTKARGNYVRFGPWPSALGPQPLALRQPTTLATGPAPHDADLTVDDEAFLGDLLAVLIPKLCTQWIGSPALFMAAISFRRPIRFQHRRVRFRLQKVRLRIEKVRCGRINFRRRKCRLLRNVSACTIDIR